MVLPFHTYLWKIASRCNLNCTYCYVYNLADQRWRLQPHFMSEEVARQTARRIFEHLRAHDKNDFRIVLHGGEPLLGGLSHLQMVMDVIDSTFEGFDYTVGMQSNGLLFTPEIGEFMLSRRMNVGVSLDGPPKYNDVYRVDHQGRPSSAMLEARLATLLSERYRKVFAGFLCVINIDNDPVEVTDYLLSFDPSGVDFLFPLDNHDRRPHGKEHDLNATPYGDWLIDSFDRWWERAPHVPVRIFDSIVRQSFGAPSLVESLGLDPIDLVVVETNGEIEGVDSLKGAFDGATRLGYNVFEHDFDTVARDAAVQRRQLGLGEVCETCRQCPVVPICGGGYVPHRYSSARGFDNPSVYSSDLMKLILHIREVAQATLRTETTSMAVSA